MSFLIFLFIIFNFSVHQTFAVTATPSAETTQDIVDLVQQKVKEKLNLITTPSSQPKAFIGNITQIDQNQITTTFQNKTQVISVGESTIYVDTKKNKTKFTSLKVGQTILSMGYLNESNGLDAKRIVIIDPKSAENTNQIVTGQIVDISKSSPIMVIIPLKDKNNQYQIKTDTKTEIVNLSGKKITSDSLASGKKVVVIIQPDPKISKTFYATKIISLESTNTVSPTPTVKP